MIIYHYKIIIYNYNYDLPALLQRLPKAAKNSDWLLDW